MAHPSCQQKLVSIWYSDLRALERSNWFFRSLLVIMVTLFYPIMCVMYLIAPKSQVSSDAVNSQIFARAIFFTNSVKRHICDIKIRNWDMIYLHQKNDGAISPFRERISLSQYFASAKYRQNKTLAKNSEFTVISMYHSIVTKMSTTNQFFKHVRRKI